MEKYTFGEAGAVHLDHIVQYMLCGNVMRNAYPAQALRYPAARLGKYDDSLRGRDCHPTIYRAIGLDAFYQNPTGLLLSNHLRTNMWAIYRTRKKDIQLF